MNILNPDHAFADYNTLCPERFHLERRKVSEWRARLQVSWKPVVLRQAHVQFGGVYIGAQTDCRGVIRIDFVIIEIKDVLFTAAAVNAAFEFCPFVDSEPVILCTANNGGNVVRFNYRCCRSYLINGYLVDCSLCALVYFKVELPSV
ncbi:hypothetical protein ACFL9U_04630 [Thermodesulfobacteriota bacterium]